MTPTGHGDKGGLHVGSHLGNALAAVAGVLGTPVRSATPETEARGPRWGPEADLVAALESGQSLAGIARAHNVDPQKVIDPLVAAARSELDAAVAAGILTQAQEDQILPLIAAV